MEKELGIPAKEIRDQEFSTFALLEFHLNIPQDEFMPHFDRLLYELDYNNMQEYLSGKPANR